RGARMTGRASLDIAYASFVSSCRRSVRPRGTPPGRAPATAAGAPAANRPRRTSAPGPRNRAAPARPASAAHAALQHDLAADDDPLHQVDSGLVRDELVI